MIIDTITPAPTTQEPTPAEVEALLKKRKAHQVALFHQLKDDMPYLRLKAEKSTLTRTIAENQVLELQAHIQLYQITQRKKEPTAEEAADLDEGKDEPESTNEHNAD